LYTFPSADEGIMGCLYCGNELTLLRKLTGYGEFCSEAHRQKYQEQYNRLALTRLLEAQDIEPERRPLATSLRGSARSSNAAAAGKAPRETEAAVLEAPLRPRYHTAPAPSHQKTATLMTGAPPDLSGFLPDLFEPAVPQTQLISGDPVLLAGSAHLPDFSREGMATQDYSGGIFGTEGAAASLRQRRLYHQNFGCENPIKAL
jgi:hypothetical protein